MIKVQITRHDNQIDSIKVSGHSGYDVSGKDIVCAGVSSVVITSVNAIMRIDDKSISYNKDEGLMDITIIKHSDVVDILIENLISLLKDMEKQYSKFIKIYE